jgi:hypothetical protein
MSLIRLIAASKTVNSASGQFKSPAAHTAQFDHLDSLPELNIARWFVILYAVCRTSDEGHSCTRPA